MKPILYLCLGVVLLAVGAYLHFGGGVSSADRQRCEQQIADMYDGSEEAMHTMAPKCDEPGMVAMMDARANNLGAEETARAVASANSGGLGGGFLPFILVGAGIGAFGAAFVERRKQARHKA